MTSIHGWRILLLCLVIFAVIPLRVAFAQDIETGIAVPTDPATPDDEALKTELDTPAPPPSNRPSFVYHETPLGRAGVLSIGVFPFSYFYAGLVLDFVRYYSHGFDASYAPWPFRTQNSIAYTNTEMWLRLGVSAAVSILFGTISALLK